MVAVSSNFATGATYILLYAVTGDLNTLFVRDHVPMPSYPDRSYVSCGCTYSFSYFSGMLPVLVGFLVAYKQSYPQSVVQLNFIKIDPKVLCIACKNKEDPFLTFPLLAPFQDGPLVIIAIMLALKFIAGLSLAYTLLAMFGFLSSWTFLRFYQRRDAVRGDFSDAFAFETFWPAPLQCV